MTENIPPQNDKDRKSPTFAGYVADQLEAIRKRREGLEDANSPLGYAVDEGFKEHQQEVKEAVNKRLGSGFSKILRILGFKKP